MLAGTAISACASRGTTTHRRETVAESLGKACPSPAAKNTGTASPISTAAPLPLNRSEPCKCPLSSDYEIAQCPDVSCVCGASCPSLLCDGTREALAFCQSGNDRFATIAIDRQYTAITLSTGYVGASYVYSNASSSLVGASTFQDFSGPMPFSDDAGVGADASIAVAATTRAGPDVSARALECIICGHPASSKLASCDRVERFPSVR